MKNIFGVVAGLSLSLLASVSQAAIVFPVGGSVQPGANCRVIGTNQNALYYDSNGRVSNLTAQAVSVICPITRQNINDGWKNIKVVVADRHTSQNISCQAFSSQVDGAGYSLTQTSVQYSPEWYQFETLTFGAPTFVRAAGTYYLTCTLPPLLNGRASMINSYSVEEKCETNYGAILPSSQLSVQANDCK